MRVLSLGAGVQSSALFLMACEGLEPIDCAVFADTGWEPDAVYEWLHFLECLGAERGVPVHRVTTGNIREDALLGFASMPLYVEKDGRRLMGQRQCTNQYKLRPIRRLLRELQPGNERVELSLGISLDEIRRMKDADVQWIKHVYPLVDRRMTRGDCIAWMNARGYRTPVKSACVGCPFRTPKDWRSLTERERADAVDFDQRIREARPGVRQFVHRDFIPLQMADWQTEQDRGQTEMDFDGCGVLCAADDMEAVA